ncbi:MAG: hypothetical protein ACI4TD_14730 [Phocaeicola sp.]
MAKTFIFSLFMAMFFIACQNESFTNDSKNEVTNHELIGDYHNEIIKNFIVYYNQDEQNSRANSDDFVQLMANYGVSVLTAFKNDPPTNGNIDQWVEQVLDVTLNETQIMMHNIMKTGVSMVDAIKIAFGDNSISKTIESYLIELNSLIQQHSGTVSYNNQINLLHIKYYSLANSQDDKTIIRWTTDLAIGSHDYWNSEHDRWAPSLYGRFWNAGKKILKADALGGLEYILATKIGIIETALSWKIGAAYAALRSIIDATDQLLLNNSRSIITEESVKNITLEEVYNAYLNRKVELGIN